MAGYTSVNDDVRPAYKRILLKLSGEALLGSQKYGIDPDACRRIAHSVKELLQLQVQVGLVVGGGNLFRGLKGASQGMDRVPADQIGMLATIINGLTLQQSLENIGCKCAVMSALPCVGIVETYQWKKALELLDTGTVILFVGGTGNPYFTTDSAAALRAFEIKAEILMKATKVNGIFDKDPLKYSDAQKFDRISYSDILAKQLQVMDATAIALCRENRIPIRVFNIFEDQSLKSAVCNQSVGTLVKGT